MFSPLPFIQSPPAHNAHPLTISTCPQCPPSHHFHLSTMPTLSLFPPVHNAPTLSPSLQTAGLGGMKPNTLVLGFYSQDLPINTLDTLHRRLLRKSKVLQYIFREKPLEKLDFVNRELPSLRTNVCEWLCADRYDCLIFMLQLEGQELGAEEYVSLIQVC